MAVDTKAKRRGSLKHPWPSAYGKRNTKRHSTEGKHARGVRPDNRNAQLVIAAVQSGKYRTMTCIASKVGISRERVRQILNATGYTEFAHRLRLEWPCPDCRGIVSLTRLQLHHTKHMPVHCRACAKKYCKREHLRAENSDRGGHCLACARIRAKRVVAVRSCLECGKTLEITMALRQHITGGRARGVYHQDCYYAYLRREGRPTSRAKRK